MTLGTAGPMTLSDRRLDSFYGALESRGLPLCVLVIEPANPIDLPGYFLNDFDQATAIIDAVSAPNLGLLFDAYHAHVITGDATSAFARHAESVRHIQIAGAPDRREPRNGAIDYRAFFHQVDASGYRGWVAAEYSPSTTTEAGLRWLREA